MNTPSAAKPLSVLAAARKVLAAAGKPLHYQEITRRILASGLWRTAGKTPEATINAQLTTSIKKLGDASPFRHTGPGLFTLASGTLEPAAPTRPSTKSTKSTTSTKSTPAHPRVRALVLGFLERISISAFSSFPRQITDLVHGKHGVYALYKGDRLYYVGLATNLRNRIKQHLGDRHAGKWNRNSAPFWVRQPTETPGCLLPTRKGNSAQDWLCVTMAIPYC